MCFTQCNVFEVANINFFEGFCIEKSYNRIIFAPTKKKRDMSFSDLFESGFQKRNADHFASIVKVAMSDGVIDDAEKAFLNRLATRLDISEHDYKEILKDYTSHPVNAPHSYDKRLERLYDLARMVWADDFEGPKQHGLLERLCVGLGFNTKNVKYIADKALCLAHEEADLDTFIEEMKNMNH